MATTAPAGARVRKSTRTRVRTRDESATDPRRSVPSVDALLRSIPGKKGSEKFGRPVVKRALSKVLDELRADAGRGAAPPSDSEILARALDYRTWHTFTVRVRDTGPDGKPRVRRLRQLSSGETRLVSYVTLFAAAASFYDAVSTGSEGAHPLRLVLLDEAFERLDDPTVARMLGLLVELDMDWIITWPSGCAGT